ncbi:MAG TPA: tripartite tricarboxylate transporter substrate binding protein [Burkholderiales bacterium]|nr:tripartite tricarboxylate transporter substrate binding protein [Burkholderiales bacterium]
MITFTRRQFLGSTGALLAGAALPTFAQTYPGKPVRFIVPFPPGGPVDTTARGFTHKLSEYWGQQAIVDNRAGAGGIVGAEIAAKSPADGYTVFVCSIHHSVLPGLKPGLPYDIEKDFVPVTFAAMFPIILVAHPSVPAKTIPELIAYAKKNPGKLAFGSAGTGGGTHLAGELFKAQAGVDLLHVPYKGSAPAMTDLLGGQVQLMFSDAPTALPHMKSGRVRALGVASPKRSPLAPDLPTISESGVKGYEAYSWAGVVAPAGTPAPIVAKLNADISKALSQPDVKQRLFEEGAEAMPTTPEQFGKMLKAEIAKWTKVVKDANIKAD